METFDYSCDAEDKVELVVRSGERYGAAKAGDHVLVAKSELANRSTMSACMTFEERAALEAKRAERKAKREAAAVPQVKAMVDEALKQQLERAMAHHAEKAGSRVTPAPAPVASEAAPRRRK